MAGPEMEPSPTGSDVAADAATELLALREDNHALFQVRETPKPNPKPKPRPWPNLKPERNPKPEFQG